MLYENYKRKIVKISEIRDKLKRYRALIIAVAAVILALLAGFLCTKGMVYSKAEIAADITYGENVNPYAGALFGRVSYEYAAQGSDEWTKTPPRLAGTYKVRAVGKRISGAPSYGKEQVYQILPKPVDVHIAQNTVVYGDLPALSAALMFDDTIACSAFNYADTSLETTQAAPDRDSIFITDGQGNDVSTCYNINIVESDITFTKRPITVTLSDSTGVYDGTPLAFNGYEISGGSLAGGDSLIATFDKVMIDAGAAENTAQLKIVSAKSADVTQRYDINTITGRLTVQKRTVYIKTFSAEKIYDGLPLSLADYSLSPDTPLVEGHRLAMISSSSLTEAGTRDNLLAFKITDGERDVTENYSFLFSQGSLLRVSPRAITVRTADASKTYDGLPLTESNYSIVSELKFVNDHTLKLNFSGAQTDKGSSENTAGAPVVSDGARNVTSNYTFEYIYGTLEVTPRQVSIKTATAELVYNGEAQSYGGFEITSQTDLAAGQTMRAATRTLTKLTDAGPAVQNRFEVEIVDGGGKDVSDNYAVSYAYGTLKIIPLHIYVTTASAQFFYNGKEQSDNSFTINPVLPGGHTAVADGSAPSLKDVTLTGGEYKKVSNVFAISVFRGADPAGGNIVIHYEYGTLVMFPQELTVTTADREFVYDGTQQSDGSFTLSPELPAGHIARIEGKPPALKNVALPGSPKEVPNSFAIVVLRDTGGGNYEDACGNYYIRYNYGTLIMLPRPVTITTATNSWEYNAKAHSDGTYTVPPGSLVLDHKIDVLAHTLTQITNVVRLDTGKVGFENNKFQVDILDGTDSVAHNYAITYDYGKLTVTPRPVEITTATNSWIYDGLSHSDPGYKVSKGSLLDGHTASMNIPGSVITGVTNVIRLPDGTVGFEYNKFAVAIFSGTGENYRDITDNYEIDYVYGTLTVMPRPVEITTNSRSWVYDGEEHYDAGYKITSGNIVGGQYHMVTGKIVTLTNVIRLDGGVAGSKDNIFTVDIFRNGTDEIATYNYDLTYVYGSLSIIPREITVAPYYSSKDYDGTPLTSQACFVMRGQLVPGQFALYDCSGSQTEIGASRNDITQVTIFYGDEDVTYNYNITKETGTLRVWPRTIYVYADSAEKYYDGRELTCPTYYLGGNSLLWGHSFSANVTGSRTEPGISSNKIEEGSVSIIDWYMQDVSGYYDIVLVEGTLQVWLSRLTVKTGSAEKEYDGTPLTCKEYEITGDFFTGDTVHLSGWNWLVWVGWVWNSVNVTVLDERKNDVTEIYLITYDLGTLTVTGDGGGLDLSGDISDTGGSGADRERVVFSAESDTDGRVYFRIKSFGDYLMNSWGSATPYLQGGINALQLTNLSLAYGGKKESSISITPVSNTMAYMIPYYASDGYATLDDTIINTPYGSPYGFSYIPYTYNANDTFSVRGTGYYEQFEKAYYQYVLGTYLQLPQTTRVKLLEIAAKNNLSAAKASVINDVARFVQNSVRYDLNFQQYFGDMAVYFFTQAKTGICQHYATAATAMFRALGIPARYVIGYVADMSAGRSVEVKSGQGHAWVEVYLQGAGWIQIEVTGGFGGPGDGPGDDDGPGDGVYSLAIKPVDVYKLYDGTPLYAKDEIEGDDLATILALEYLSGLGYSWAVTVSGSRTEHGVSESRIISFILYDPGGQDVTGQWEIIYKPGQVRITFTPILVCVYSLQKYYDGTPLSYESDDYWLEDLPEGFKLIFSLSGSLTEAGILKLTDLEKLPYTLYDKSGVNVSAVYSLVFVGEPLRVDYRAIEITSASAAKAYDGKPLTKNLAWISKGYFPANHICVIAVSGTITDIGFAENEISAVNIYDEHGGEVTHNYLITFNLGILRIDGD